MKLQYIFEFEVLLLILFSDFLEKFRTDFEFWNRFAILIFVLEWNQD